MSLEPMSPEWFLDRLHAELMRRKSEVDFFDAYYTGDHPLPWLAPQAREEFRRLVRMTRSNYMGLVCDATAERASVEGFRFPDSEVADQATWGLWTANDLDSESDTAWLEALICGRSFFLVAPNLARPDAPNIWVEHASQCVVAYEPGTNRRERRAGLKVWADDWTGENHATLYLRDDAGELFLFKYRSVGSHVDGAPPRWIERTVPGEEWPARAGNLPVPLVEVENNPRLMFGGVSELYDVTDIQDRINKTLFDRMQTQEFGVDPQKWAKAFPTEDRDGNPNVVEFGKNRMVTTDVAETAFGNFAVAPLSPYLEAKREDVKDIASRTRTPAQYLLGEMSNVNGETLKASESGLISKVQQRTKDWSRATKEVMQIARILAGVATPADSMMETMWSDPQYRTEGERTDAAIKRYQAGITPLAQTREDLNYTQTQIRRMEAADATEAGALAAVGVKAVRDAAVGGA